MSEPQRSTTLSIHFSQRSRFDADPEEGYVICGVAEREKRPPTLVTTTDPEQVTCGLCLRGLRSRGLR